MAPSNEHPICLSCKSKLVYRKIEKNKAVLLCSEKTCTSWCTISDEKVVQKFIPKVFYLKSHEELVKNIHSVLEKIKQKEDTGIHFFVHF